MIYGTVFKIIALTITSTQSVYSLYTHSVHVLHAATSSSVLTLAHIALAPLDLLIGEEMGRKSAECDPRSYYVS